MRAYHCESPACKLDVSTFTKTYYLDSPEAPCPSCGLSGHLVQCERIHLIVPMRNGPIHSKVENKNYGFLCHRAQKNFVLYPPGHPMYPMFYTAVPQAATCQECLIEFGAKFINAERLILG
jgi:hypothetical protein